MKYIVYKTTNIVNQKNYSIQEVSKEFNLHTSSINRVLRGLQKVQKTIY